jgi:hypothetical protein
MGTIPRITITQKAPHAINALLPRALEVLETIATTAAIAKAAKLQGVPTLVAISNNFSIIFRPTLW